MFMKEGKWKDGKKPEASERTRRIPRDSIVGVSKGGFNYITICGGMYVGMNRGVHPPSGGMQIIRVCVNLMKSRYPARMWCSTCVCKRKDIPTPRPKKPEENEE